MTTPRTFNRAACGSSPVPKTGIAMACPQHPLSPMAPNTSPIKPAPTGCFDEIALAQKGVSPRGCRRSVSELEDCGFEPDQRGNAHLRKRKRPGGVR